MRPGGAAVCSGTVYHRRVRPVANAFTYPVFYVQLPVADPATARGPMFAVDGWGVLGFRTRDHGPRDGSPLRPWIRARLREHGRLIHQPGGQQALPPPAAEDEAGTATPGDED